MEHITIILDETNSDFVLEKKRCILSLSEAINISLDTRNASYINRDIRKLDKVANKFSRRSDLITKPLAYQFIYATATGLANKSSRPR
jgi:hypothetical protein